MNKIKNIPHPQFKNARRLSPLELNSFRCEKKHTLLSPEKLEEIAEAARQSTSQKTNT